MNVNNHHMNFYRKQFLRDDVGRFIFIHPGMQVPLSVPVHKELHDNIKGIRPPIRSLGKLILAVLEDADPNPIVNLHNLASFTLGLAEYAGSSRLGDDAFRVGSFYTEQALFLAENQHGIRTRDEL